MSRTSGARPPSGAAGEHRGSARARGRRRARAAAVAVVVALASAAPAAGAVGDRPAGSGLLAGADPGQHLAVPAPPVQLPGAVEALSPYLPQVSCDPRAKPGVVAFSEMALDTYGGRSLGIVRACDIGAGSEHKEGRAWDWGLDADDPTDARIAARFLDWLLADGAVHARRTGVMYVIWNRRIWGSYRADEGWRPYHGSNPHTDHIHISFSWSGAMQRTSWWTGQVAPTEYGPCILVPGAHAHPYDDAINLDPCPPAGASGPPEEPDVPRLVKKPGEPRGTYEAASSSGEDYFTPPSAP